MKLGVISSSHGWHLRDLCRAAHENGFEITQLDFRDLCGSICETGAQSKFGASWESDFDCLLVRAMPRGSLEEIVVRMDLLDQISRSGVSVVNPAKSIECAVDKYLCLLKLSRKGICIPESAVFQTIEPALQFAEHVGYPIIYKPLFGSEGKGMQLLADAEIAEQAFNQLREDNSVLYLQKYYQIEKDLRLLVVGNKVFSMQRTNADDWRKNICVGGKATWYQPSSEEQRIALEAANTIGAVIAGVDLLVTSCGKTMVIEVNTAPGWRALQSVTKFDIATEIMRVCAGKSVNCQFQHQ